MSELQQPFAEPKDGADAGKLWHRRIEHSIKWREKKWNADAQWRQNLRLDRGIHWESGGKDGETEPSSDNPRERIQVNLVQSYVRDFLAFLFKNTPKFLCRPRRPEDVGSAKLQQELVNYFWKEKRWIKQARRAVRDLIVLGTCVMRTGWVLELDASVKPDEFGEVEYDDAVRQDEPIVKRVNPAKFLIDPAAPECDLDSARWVAEVFHKPLADVLVSVKYDPDVLLRIRTSELTPTLVDEAEESKHDGSLAREVLEGEEAANRLVRIFDLWDKKYRRHYLLLDGVDEPLLAENWPYEHLDGFPYVLAVYDELNDEVYGLGLPAAMEDQQFELNRIRTAEFEHRRRFGKIRLQRQKGAIDPLNVAKLLSGEDCDIEVNQMDGLKAFEMPQLPTDNYKVEEIIKEDIRLLIGADQLTNGGSLPSRTSATEINARSGYTGMKIESRVQVVDDLLSDVTRQVLQHMKAYLTVPQAVRVQGPRGVLWSNINRDEIAAEVDLDIVTVSAERVDENMLRQQSLQLLETLLQQQQTLAAFGQQVNLPRLLQFVLEERFGEQAYEEFVIPIPPPPVAPEMAGGAGGDSAGAAQSVGIPPQQQAAQQAAVRPESAALGGAMGSLSGG